MKKLFLIAAILSASVVANAQFKFGVKAGAHLSHMNYTDDKAIFGFNAGVLGQVKFANFAVQPEVLFSMQGTGAEGVSGSVFKFNYINIPVMFQYFLIPGLAIEAGPQVGILLSAKMLGLDAKKACNTIDIAAAVGASFELPVIPLGFFARYTLGFTGIIKDAGDDAGRNHVMQLGAFFKF